MAQVPARNPKYSAADLWPPGSKDRDFPPAAFFPVYVGNFLCQQRAELVARVQQYFASKGLLARMVFVRSAQNDPFQSYQDKTKLYDCLVYLTRQRDAQDAVKYLHRDKYYGHRLNVFPGRKRLYFESDKAVTVRQLAGVAKDSPLESFETELEKITAQRVVCSARNSKEHVLVDFGDAEKLQQALKVANKDTTFLFRISTDVCRQRFVEQDVRGKIKRNKGLRLLPNFTLQRALYEGKSIDDHGALLYEPSPRAGSNLDYVQEAMGKIRELADERRLSVAFHVSMFPDLDEELTAVVETARGNLNAESFLRTYRAPWRVKQKQLTLLEQQHVELHHDGMEYLRRIVEGINYEQIRLLEASFK
uniref:(northern house mosquito) hypothetical protein n=1 Tax=Culex pipiens TaxID=7175 RepID=A0A8D8G5Z0_CULPI